MKLATAFAVLTAATIGAASAVALAQGSNNPPAPRPAAGALPQASSKAEVRSARTQTAEEQKATSQSSAVAPNSSRKRK
jgi:hypothetical protein